MNNEQQLALIRAAMPVLLLAALLVAAEVGAV